MDENNYGNTKITMINFKNGDEKKNLLLPVHSLCNLCKKESNCIKNMWAELTPLIKELDNLSSTVVKSDLSLDWIYVRHSLKALVDSLDTLDNPGNYNKEISNKASFCNKPHYIDDDMIALLECQLIQMNMKTYLPLDKAKICPSLGIPGQCPCIPTFGTDYIIAGMACIYVNMFSPPNQGQPD